MSRLIIQLTIVVIFCSCKRKTNELAINVFNVEMSQISNENLFGDSNLIFRREIKDTLEIAFYKNKNTIHTIYYYYSTEKNNLTQPIVTYNDTSVFLNNNSNSGNKSNDRSFYIKKAEYWIPIENNKIKHIYFIDN